MPITRRRYSLLWDFRPMLEFYGDIYHKPRFHLTPQFFEYAHYHPYFDHTMAHRNAIWEEDGRIIASAMYEMRLGECMLACRPGYEALRPALLDWAMENLYAQGEDGERTLKIWAAQEEGFDDLLKENGFEPAWRERVMLYPYEKGFSHRPLPDGFTLHDLREENDPLKLRRCLWYGFDHGDEGPFDPDTDDELHMQTAPHFRPDLSRVVKAPNGDYACYAGMWVDVRHGYAYLEPLVTMPQYRRMGLATCAFMAAMRATQAEGARYSYSGSREFYEVIGCENAGEVVIWKKTWGD